MWLRTRTRRDSRPRLGQLSRIRDSQDRSVTSVAMPAPEYLRRCRHQLACAASQRAAFRSFHSDPPTIRFRLPPVVREANRRFPTGRLGASAPLERRQGCLVAPSATRQLPLAWRPEAALARRERRPRASLVVCRRSVSRRDRRACSRRTARARFAAGSPSMPS